MRCTPTNRLVDRTDAEINAAIAANPQVRNIVAAYSDLVSPLASQVIGIDHRRAAEQRQRGRRNAGRRA